MSLLLTSSSFVRRLCRFIILLSVMNRYPILNRFFRRWLLSLRSFLPSSVFAVFVRVCMFVGVKVDVLHANVEHCCDSVRSSLLSLRLFPKFCSLLTRLFKNGLLDRIFPSITNDYSSGNINGLQMYDVVFPQVVDEFVDVSMCYPDFFDPSNGFLSGSGFLNIPSTDVLRGEQNHAVNLLPRTSRRAFIHYWLSRYLSTCFWLWRSCTDPVGFALDFMVAPVFIHSFTLHEVILAENNPQAFTSGHLVVPFLSILFFPVPSAVVKILSS